MINYDAIFFSQSQGVIDMCYWKKMLKKRGKIADSPIAPIIFVGGLLVYSITSNCQYNRSPTVYSNMGHLFFYPGYPLYSSYGLQWEDVASTPRDSGT